ncbi:recombinase-like helix-turn-helix domain-containing protein [Nocardia jiangxiensis]|uniref:Recombinase-like helix-turn-helix domain-containing protein n=1 Tax=Nocardia jiangxiensis TaxID=282685 RepID=A0ABW6RTS6_9NOCA|nr:recombinase-like helix-turn-helix domain-containing protein [Nocardia jiangxiensis]
MNDQYLLIHQARTGEPTPYEMKLAGAIEEVFGGGSHTLDALVAGLNGRSIYAPDGQAWTAESFTTEIARLGAR